MMFRVGIGPLGEEAYLRPETCQGIFVDAPFLFKTQRIKLPKGFAQLGEELPERDRAAPGDSRQREFYQAEIEVLFNPARVDLPKFDVALGYSLNIAEGESEHVPVKVSDAIAAGKIPNKLIGYYLYLIQSFYESAGLPSSGIRLRKLGDKEKAFYSAVAFDLEVKTSVGWLELVACNYRTDYDFKRHAEVSKSDYSVEDEGAKVVPHVFELSMGIDRSLYALMESAYRVEEARTYLALEIRAGAAPGRGLPAGLEGRPPREGLRDIRRAPRSSWTPPMTKAGRSGGGTRARTRQASPSA